jgi:Tfp pilus assembly protein PilE
MGALWKLIPWQAWAVAAMLAALAYTGYRGQQYERARIERAALIEAAKRIKDMESTNEEFRNLSARERCRAFLRDSGLHSEECDKR